MPHDDQIRSDAPSDTQNSLHDQMLAMGKRARIASTQLAQHTAEARTSGLKNMAACIRDRTDLILTANAQDMDAARARDLAPPLLDRLELTPARLEGVAAGLDTIAALPDPVGQIVDTRTRPNGLEISRVRGPIGVIGIIYESRPNVTADAGSLCIRAGNAAILRGGSESLHSSTALGDALRAGLAQADLPEDAVQLVPVTDRAAVGYLLSGLDGTLDLVVPRGGKGLVARVQQEARIPVLGHLEGLCHTYIHASADLEKAVAIVRNAKLRRTGVCGATETLLLDAAIAKTLLPKIAQSMPECELRGDPDACAITPMQAASEADWLCEYLAPILSVRIIDGLDAAIAHIAKYGSGHTEAIIAEDTDIAERFLHQVDAAIVMHNSSTQFADGGEFGMGAEIGISTGRLHARGPVGAEELTICKFVVRGTGQIRP